MHETAKFIQVDDQSRRNNLKVSETEEKQALNTEPNSRDDSLRRSNEIVDELNYWGIKALS